MVRFLNDMGHKQISFICGPLFDPSAGRRRMEGYKKGLEECKITYAESLVSYCTHFTIECGYMAIGTMGFLQDNGILVPQQISVAGIDDINLAVAYRPKLTTLRHATFEQGAKATDMLFEFLRDPEFSGIEYRMPYKILRRQSVMQIIE